MILSWTLPPRAVGLRRIPLLSRDANRVATEQFSPLLQVAHDTAMAGAPWTWQHDASTTHKMAAVLAGLALLLSSGGKGTDVVRKQDAFSGRVNLPFLVTREPADPGCKRLFYEASTDAWIVYQLRSSRRTLVHSRDTGLEGLCTAALMLTEQTRQG